MRKSEHPFSASLVIFGAPASSSLRALLNSFRPEMETVAMFAMLHLRSSLLARQLHALRLAGMENAPVEELFLRHLPQLSQCLTKPIGQEELKLKRRVRLQFHPRRFCPRPPRCLKSH